MLEHNCAEGNCRVILDISIYERVVPAEQVATSNISSSPPIQIWLPCMDTPRAQQLFGQGTRVKVPKISHYTQSRIGMCSALVS